jgi:hypothetical protein
MHQRTATLSRHDQRLDGRLPVPALVLGLRQSRDVIGGFLEGDELSAMRQQGSVRQTCGTRCLVPSGEELGTDRRDFTYVPDYLQGGLVLAIRWQINSQPL